MCCCLRHNGLYFAVVFLLGAFIASAGYAGTDIAVTGLSGDYSQGSTVVIQGGGFGTKSPAAPMLWDDFEGNAIGKSVDKPLIGSYSRVGPTVYSNKVPYTGSVCAVSEIRSGVGSPGLISDWKPLQAKNAFVAMKWKVVSTYGSLEPFNFKLIRTNASDPDPTHGYPNYNIGKERGQTKFSGIINHGQIPGQLYSGSFDTDKYAHGEWNSISIYDHIGGVGTEDGFVGRVINGNVSSKTNCVTLLPDRSLGGLRSAFFAGYMTHEGYDSDLFLDDVYADITLARVELFSSNGVREMQIPVEWNDSRIEIKFNQGRYKAGNVVNIVVYDEYNNASSPFSLTIEGSGNVNSPGQPGQPVINE